MYKFNPNRIYTNHDGNRFLCNCVCDSVKTANGLLAGFIGSVQAYDRRAMLYTTGRILVLDTTSRGLTLELIHLINDAM